MINIDGSYGEGGGQIIRTSLTLAALTQQAVIIKNIRANRPKPGLAAQHLMSCQSIAKICHGKLAGAKLKSAQLEFTPGKIKSGNYKFDIGTAGSVILVAQSIIPLLLLADSKSHVTITGGTHVIKSPGFDYFNEVFLPAIKKFGADVSTKLIKPGYYPKGGGCIELFINPSSLNGCTHWQTADEPHAIIRLANLPEHITEREKQVLLQNRISDVKIYHEKTFSPSNVVTIWRGFRGVNVLGERSKKAEVVAQEACDLLQKEHADVDSHLADQLLIYAIIAAGTTKYKINKITEHLQTNVYIIKQFYDRKLILSDDFVKVI